MCRSSELFLYLGEESFETNTQQAKRGSNGAMQIGASLNLNYCFALTKELKNYKKVTSRRIEQLKRRGSADGGI